MLVSRSSIPSRGVRLLLDCPGALRGKAIVVGLAAGVDHHSAIVEALSGKPGPRTTVVAANVSGSRGKRCFQYNGMRFGPKAAQIKRLPGVLLEFALGRSEVKVQIGGNQIAASLPQDIGEHHQEFHCFVVGLGPEAVKPCWSMRE